MLTPGLTPSVPNTEVGLSGPAMLPEPCCNHGVVHVDAQKHVGKLDRSLRRLQERVCELEDQPHRFPLQQFILDLLWCGRN